MFVGILLRDPARDFDAEFESLRHREIFEISARGQKTIGSHLNGWDFSHFSLNLCKWFEYEELKFGFQFKSPAWASHDTRSQYGVYRR